MARLCPPRFPYPNEPKKFAEKQFYSACERQLSDEWTILYSQEWHGSRNGQNQSGEADFLMLSPNHGIYVVEVKGGAEVYVRDGEWYTMPHGKEVPERIRNPFTQAADSKFVLWDWIRKNVPTVRLKGELGHLVVFPGHRQDGDISPQARRELICDGQDLRDLPKTMDRVSRYFSQKTRITEREAAEIKEKLMPSLRLIGSKQSRHSEFIDQLDQLTDMQLTAFAMLRHQPNLNIHGGAGTGKTVLAFHRALELWFQGEDVLFLCHSEPLGNLLEMERDKQKTRSTTTSRFEIYSWVDFEVRFLHKSGFNESGRGRYDDDLIAYLSQTLQTSDYFDALVIDEAQLIPRVFGEIAQLLLKPDGFQYIFGDPNQAVSPSDHSDYVLMGLGSENPIELTINCRSSKQIAQLSNSIVKSENQTIGRDYEDVWVATCDRTGNSDLGDHVSHILRTYHFEYGIDKNDIQVLLPWNFVEEAFLADERSFIDDLGLYEVDDLIIDWLGHDYSRLSFLTTKKLVDGFKTDTNVSGSDDSFMIAKFEAWRSDRRKQIVSEMNTEDGSYDYPKFLKEFEAARSQILKSSTVPIFNCAVLHNFVGLEAEAVIAILPDVSRGRYQFHQHLDFRREIYTMVTRARALLTIIGNEQSVAAFDEMLL